MEPGARPAVPDPIFTIAGGLAFIAGAASPFSLELLGELFWSELLLPVFALIALTRSWPSATFRDSAFRALMLASALTLAGYMVSDLVAGTESDQYLRGWSRVLVLLSNTVSLAVLCNRNPWVLVWFCVGSAVGGIVNGRLEGVSITKWKFGYAEPLTLLAAAGCVFLPRMMAAACLGLMGAYSVLMDYRSLGAVLIGSALAVLLRPRAEQASSGKVRLVVLAVAGVAALQVISALLGASQENFSGRRAVSDVNRFASLRIGAQAILDSPLIGHGSWGQGTEKYADLLYAETRDEMLAVGADNQLRHGSVFVAHSQVIQAWMEGGLLGVSFFLVYGWLMLSRGWRVLMKDAAGRFAPLALILLLLNLWNFVMSPFNGLHRLNISMAAAALIVLCAGHVIPGQHKAGTIGIAGAGPSRRPVNLMT